MGITPPNSAVSFAGIGKRFGAFTALDNVSFEVESGTVHAVVGENGAGKTTLMKILYGILRADGGEFRVMGQARQYKNAEEATRDGVGMISQHYSVIPELTNIQNLMLGSEGGFWVNEKAACLKADTLAKTMGLQFDWLKPSALLSPTQAQQLEILKLLWREARIMLLDEPTAMLAPEATNALYARVKGLVAEGRTVIVVTHRLEDVLKHAQNVTVMRAGKAVKTVAVASTSEAELTELMFGDRLDTSAELPPRPAGAVKLRVKDLVVKGDRGNRAVDGVSLDLHVGEVVGVAGVDGNGQKELMECLAGVRGAESGSILWEDQEVLGESTLYRLTEGFRLVPEDRLTEAAIDSWSVEENVRLGLQRLSSPLQSAAAGAVGKFSAKVSSGKQEFGSLSGGNQQRVILGRAATSQPKLILATQPARGLDFQATVAAYQGLRDTECPCLVVGFDLDELLKYCDRVVVMSHGKIMEPPRDRQAIGAMMVAGG